VQTIQPQCSVSPPVIQPVCELLVAMEIHKQMKALCLKFSGKKKDIYLK
jgi:hypothetical protein